MKKKGLGKELGAIFGDAAIDDILSDANPPAAPVKKQAQKSGSAVSGASANGSAVNGSYANGTSNGTYTNGTSTNDFEYVPMHRLEPNREQPRTLFEQEKIDELTESIKEHGVLSPPLVRRLDNGYYKIVAGERRWRAARAAELSEMPVRIIAADDKNSLELALVENLQREDLNPIEEARGFRALLDGFEMTQEEVAARVGRSRPMITNALRLLTLPDDLIELVSIGKLHAGSARALMGLKNKDKESLLEVANEAIKGEMSVREVERLVKLLNLKSAQEEKNAEKEKAEEIGNGKNGTNGVDVDYTLDAQKRLTKALGRRAAIKHGHNKSVIEIEFHGKDDFNALFDALVDFGISKLGGHDDD